MLPLLRRGRRLPARAAAALSLLLVAPVLAVAGTTSPAAADDDRTLTVVGTSDVFDSFLVQKVLEPEFEKAYPQYDLQYVSRGTGAALALARTGAASAALVHAAGLENQFVAEGYSAEPYGRAVFWGDYVLLGPASDPAGVLTNAPHDIVTAYERVAAAGALGQAEFVSRGGTPGTTVQEHAIWAETDASVVKCDVSAANGGGQSPSTTPGACANPINYPSWYHATGLTQGPNVLAGDACNGYASNACYVFTDRGTFNYLQSQNSIARLGIVTRDNTAPGQEDLLINSFHAYAVNPAKFSGNSNVRINLPAATAFLNWVTSPEGQAAVGRYLSSGPDRIPFIPSAAPSLTASHPQTVIDPGGTVTVTGALRNVVPGTPALSGEPVRLVGRSGANPGSNPVTVATATTAADGTYTLSYRPRETMTYFVASSRIAKLENAALNPPFGDILQPTSTAPWTVASRSTVTLKKAKVKAKAKSKKRKVTLTGAISPSVVGGGGKLRLYAGRPGNKLVLKQSKAVAAGTSGYSKTFNLPRGTFRVRLTYVNPGSAESSTTGTKTVRVR